MMIVSSGVVGVSIHAPVMDANIGNTKRTEQTSFNPRARDGREYC